MHSACTLAETAEVQRQMARIREALHERLRQELRGQRVHLPIAVPAAGGAIGRDVVQRVATAMPIARRAVTDATPPPVAAGPDPSMHVRAQPAAQAWWHDAQLSLLILGSLLDPARHGVMDGFMDEGDHLVFMDEGGADHLLRLQHEHELLFHRHRQRRQHLRHMHDIEHAELMAEHAALRAEQAAAHRAEHAAHRAEHAAHRAERAWRHAHAQEAARGAAMHRAHHMMRHVVLDLPGARPGLAMPAQLLNSVEAAVRPAAEAWAVTLATARDIMASLTRVHAPRQAADASDGEGAAVEARSSEVVAQTSKVCPGCFQQITRAEGCNLMHHAVVSCGAKFCWRCLRTGMPTPCSYASCLLSLPE